MFSDPNFRIMKRSRLFYHQRSFTFESSIGSTCSYIVSLNFIWVFGGVFFPIYVVYHKKNYVLVTNFQIKSLRSFLIYLVYYAEKLKKDRVKINEK